MAESKSRVNEEKYLNELFVLLEFSNSFKEFVSGMDRQAFNLLLQYMTERDAGVL